ncbi:MAG: flagellar biosynthesis anti-sigma factor FlgM [Planctomycetota bacterium]|jgi:flagellar biosynthesis anti-sigma factor FlgM|nr:flagellar biosynthesis anti-sigma factor FlgM [Planctomycetota bacterium]
MEIQGPGNSPRTNRISESKRSAKPAAVDSGSAPSADSVQISEMAQYLSKLSRVEDIRKARVSEIRQAIEKGDFVTKEKLHTALSRMIDEIWGDES